MILMAQLVFTNRIVWCLILLQIYCIRRSSAEYFHVVKNFTTKDGYIGDIASRSCCVNDECDILCCIRRGNCFYSNIQQRLPNVINNFQANLHRQKRMIGSTTTVCYNGNNRHHLALWKGLPPGAVGDDPCKDIPFLEVFRPSRRAPRTDAAIIIFPGGGYHRLTNTKEKAPVARYFAEKLGITSFILYYRRVQQNGVYRYPIPMWDGQRAIRYVRDNAAHFNINPSLVGVFGFSAGGHLASTIALHSQFKFGLSQQDHLDRLNARPNFLGLGYPVISMDPNQYGTHASHKYLLRGYAGDKQIRLENFLSGQKHVNSYAPPTFIFVSLDDRLINSQNSLLFVKALQRAGVPHKALIFKHGKHGAGLARDEPEEHVWPELFSNWLVKTRIIQNA